MTLLNGEPYIHSYTVETVHTAHGKGDSFRVDTTHRYVCVCGWATQRCRDIERARRQIARHALDGQTARPR